VKKYLARLWDQAVQIRRDNSLNLLEPDPTAILVDLGCCDGSIALECARKIGTENTQGVEIAPEFIEKAEQQGVEVRTGDLNVSLPYESESVDVIHASQVIEHLADTTQFLLEIARVLKPGGYAVISTENAASWHNVVSLLFGWQMFSLTNISTQRSGIGNPLAIHRNEDGPLIKSMEHCRIYSYRGLKEHVESVGLIVEKILGSGYYPLPAVIGKYDPRHAHFLSIKARKPQSDGV